MLYLGIHSLYHYRIIKKENNLNDDDDNNEFQAGDNHGRDASDSIEQSSSFFEESTDDLSASIEESPQDLGKDI